MASSSLLRNDSFKPLYEVFDIQVLINADIECMAFTRPEEEGDLLLAYTTCTVDTDTGKQRSLNLLYNGLIFTMIWFPSSLHAIIQLSFSPDGAWLFCLSATSLFMLPAFDMISLRSKTIGKIPASSFHSLRSRCSYTFGTVEELSTVPLRISNATSSVWWQTADKLVYNIVGTASGDILFIDTSSLECTLQLSAEVNDRIISLHVVYDRGNQLVSVMACPACYILVQFQGGKTSWFMLEWETAAGEFRTIFDESHKTMPALISTPGVIGVLSIDQGQVIAVIDHDAHRVLLHDAQRTPPCNSYPLYEYITVSDVEKVVRTKHFIIVAGKRVDAKGSDSMTPVSSRIYIISALRASQFAHHKELDWDMFNKEAVVQVVDIAGGITSMTVVKMKEQDGGDDHGSSSHESEDMPSLFAEDDILISTASEIIMLHAIDSVQACDVFKEIVISTFSSVSSMSAVEVGAEDSWNKEREFTALMREAETFGSTLHLDMNLLCEKVARELVCVGASESDFMQAARLFRYAHTPPIQIMSILARHGAWRAVLHQGREILKQSRAFAEEFNKDDRIAITDCVIQALFNSATTAPGKDARGEAELRGLMLNRRAELTVSRVLPQLAACGLHQLLLEVGLVRGCLLDALEAMADAGHLVLSDLELKWVLKTGNAHLLTAAAGGAFVRCMSPDAAIKVFLMDKPSLLRNSPFIISILPLLSGISLIKLSQSLVEYLQKPPVVVSVAPTVTKLSPDVLPLSPAAPGYEMERSASSEDASTTRPRLGRKLTGQAGASATSTASVDEELMAMATELLIYVLLQISMTPSSSLLSYSALQRILIDKRGLYRPFVIAAAAADRENYSVACTVLEVNGLWLEAVHLRLDHVRKRLSSMSTLSDQSVSASDSKSSTSSDLESEVLSLFVTHAYESSRSDSKEDARLSTLAWLRGSDASMATAIVCSTAIIAFWVEHEWPPSALEMYWRMNFDKLHSILAVVVISSASLSYTTKETNAVPPFTLLGKLQAVHTAMIQSWLDGCKRLQVSNQFLFDLTKYELLHRQQMLLDADSHWRDVRGVMKRIVADSNRETERRERIRIHHSVFECGTANADSFFAFFTCGHQYSSRESFSAAVSGYRARLRAIHAERKVPDELLVPLGEFDYGSVEIKVDEMYGSMLASTSRREGKELDEKIAGSEKGIAVTQVACPKCVENE